MDVLNLAENNREAARLRPVNTVMAVTEKCPFIFYLQIHLYDPFIP